VTGRSDGPASIPAEIWARIARPTIRLTGSVGHPMVASFFDQLLPVLEVENFILVELFTDGGDAEIGRRLAEEVRLLRQLRRLRDLGVIKRVAGTSCRIGRAATAALCRVTPDRDHPGARIN
jgi:hypothetical protein